VTDDPYRRRVEAEADLFVNIEGLGHQDAARRIHDDGVDILVEMTGFTQGARLEICALRPAPVQVSYLGFPASSGSDFFDYVLCDEIVVPPDQAGHYTERLAYVGSCYQANDNTQPEPQGTAVKGDFGLDDAAVVLCSFNHTYKIDPEIFSVWMRILRRVDNGVLWLRGQDATVEANLKREATARGVDPDRLVFADRVSRDRHLERLAICDLALDTRVYNGGATTSLCLWAGVPVIALAGQHFVSRMSTSLLAAVGLEGLVADTLQDYEDLAVTLATDRARLADIRARLWENRRTHPLFDTPGFVKNLESVYREMWVAACQGRADTTPIRPLTSETWGAV
jgi:protein O-GlcNAc transferase